MPLSCDLRYSLQQLPHFRMLRGIPVGAENKNPQASLPCSHRQGDKVRAEPGLN